MLRVKEAKKFGSDKKSVCDVLVEDASGGKQSVPWRQYSKEEIKIQCLWPALHIDEVRVAVLFNCEGF